MRAETKRILRENKAERGIGRTKTGAVTVCTRWVRYQVMRRGMRRGPKVKRRVLRLRTV